MRTVRATLRDLAKWRPPETPPPEYGIDEHGHEYIRVSVVFWKTPKPWVLGVWVAWYWTLRYWAHLVAGRFSGAK